MFSKTLLSETYLIRSYLTQDNRIITNKLFLKTKLLVIMIRISKWMSTAILLFCGTMTVLAGGDKRMVNHI